MSRRIMLIPLGFGVGLTSISIGMVRAMEQKGLNVGFVKPIRQQANMLPGDNSAQGSKSLSLKYVEEKISDGQHDIVLEEIVENFEKTIQDDQIAVIEGLVPTQRMPYAGRINRDIARALSAEIVFVAAPDQDTPKAFEDRIEVSADTFGGLNNKRVIGCIINKIGGPDITHDGMLPHDELAPPPAIDFEQWQSLKVFKREKFKLLGCVPWQTDLVAPRVSDIQRYLGASILNKGDIDTRRVSRLSFCARSVSNIMSYLQPGCLLVTPGDRTDVIIATCLSALNGTQIGGLLLTGGFKPNEKVLELCQQAFATGLPVLTSPSDTWQTSRRLLSFKPEVPEDDAERLERVKNFIAEQIDNEWLDELANSAPRQNLMSPPAFRHKLAMLASKANKMIVLPEGNEPRTIVAAATCAERGISRCQLLGNEEEIRLIAEQQGVVLSSDVVITDPEAIREQYVAPMVELRKAKGLTEVVAREQLEDNMVLATMMLEQGHVDGIVSGAVNTTANTIRPPLQLIKTAPGSSLVSSIFFMLLPDQVLVYGDCAINPDPTAEQLADIAIQSADSAALFGIEPRVAMISYSTGSSGAGSDVEKVAKATEIAKQKRPDLVLDGPLQYDAAIMENVASKKAPNSPVAGKATVFVFPDLNTGNTTYKAVQRSADLISIGPLLQGMRKPVNDLSRGALVDDIIYTIALTAIQATL